MSSDQLSPLVADLHLLTVLAATRSFTEAARRLGVSKASASMRISELERVAGVTLVRRTTRSVGLTEAGQQLVNELQPAFNRISDSYSAVRDLVGAPRGLVRVTAPVALGRQHLARRVAAFLQRYPDIHIELELTDRFVNLASEGFDLAIRHTSTPPDTHVAWTLCHTRSLLLASPDYLARRGVPAHPSELAAHDCLLYLGGSRGGHGGNWTFARADMPALAASTGRLEKAKTAKTEQAQPSKKAATSAKALVAAKAARAGRSKAATADGPDDERVGVSITGVLQANNSEVLREALLAGLGIGLLPDFSVPAEGLVEVLPGWQVQGFFGDRIYALRPWSAQVPKAVQVFVEYLRESMAPGFDIALPG